MSFPYWNILPSTIYQREYFPWFHRQSCLSLLARSSLRWKLWKLALPVDRSLSQECAWTSSSRQCIRLDCEVFSEAILAQEARLPMPMKQMCPWLSWSFKFSKIQNYNYLSNTLKWEFPLHLITLNIFLWFYHNIWIGCKICCLMMAAPTRVITTATTFTVS